MTIEVPAKTGRKGRPSTRVRTESASGRRRQIHLVDVGLWIKNNINCSGYDDSGTYNYVIVHETDPRYTGNPEWEIWGTWEYHVLTTSGQGNLVKPSHTGA